MNLSANRGVATPFAAALRSVILVAMVVVVGTGCATTRSNPDDPLEGYNRAMFSVNESLDKAVIKPVAEAYEAAVPYPVRTGVGNVFSNLGEPWIGINNLLQGKVAEALTDMMRFLVNSTFGIVGVLDVASEMGLPKHDEDFGQTLGYWGVGEGPYLVLPVFGPRTVRDAIAFPLDMAMDDVWATQHIPTRNTMTALRLTHNRARVLGLDRTLDEATIDKYSYVRDFYLEQRRYKVFDGSPPREYEDFDDELGGLPAGKLVDRLAFGAVGRLELLDADDVRVMRGPTPRMN